MTAHLRAKLRGVAGAAIFCAALAGAGIAATGPAAASATSQALQGLVDAANGTIKALESAVDGLRKQIGDSKLGEAMGNAKTPADKKKALEDRLRRVTGLDKNQPLPDKPPDWASDEIKKAFMIRALLDMIETWKKLKDGWADAYKKLTGTEARQVALLLPPGRNICNTDQFVYSKAVASTTQLAGSIPRIDFAGRAEPVILADSRRLLMGGALEVPSAIDTISSAYLSSGSGGWIAGQGLEMSLGALPARAVGGTTVGGDWTIGYQKPLSIGLRYSHSDTLIDGSKTYGVQYDCPASSIEQIQVLRPGSSGTFYGKDALAGVTNFILKTECHRTASVDNGNPPNEVAFERSPLLGGYMCPSDAAGQGRMMANWAAAFRDRGIQVDPASSKTEYLGVRAGMGYCVTSFDRYTIDKNQCVGDLSQIQRPDYELAQPRQGQPAVEGPGLSSNQQIAQATGQRRAAAPAHQIAALPNDQFFNSKDSLRPGLDDQWALKRIGFASAGPDGAGSLWPKSATPMLVAVVDSGVDVTHPDLAGAIWANPKEVAGDGRYDDGNGYVDDVFGWNFVNGSNNTLDNNGHGTFVAGIIAAQTHDVIGIAGVNPWARILPVKVTDFDNKGDHLHLAQGIYYAAEMGARVINVSVGGKKLPRGEQYAIDFAVKKGALVVVAAGNDGIDIADFSPAGINSVITVAATDDADKRAAFSNHGVKVDISAPGVDILSLRARGTDLMALYDKAYKPGANVVGQDGMHYRLSGTSFAAPFVSGVASLILSIDPSLKPEQVKRMILQSTRDLETPGHDETTGYGLLDAKAALSAGPNRYIDARITGVGLFQQGGQPVLVPSGTAGADRLAKAWIEVGQGSRPTSWTKGGEDITRAVDSGPLAPVPARLFTGPGQWTLKLVVEHADGTRREGRHELNLK
jgi:subtilisin family serine protease